MTEELRGSQDTVAELRDALVASGDRAEVLVGELEAKEDQLRATSEQGERQRSHGASALSCTGISSG